MFTFNDIINIGSNQEEFEKLSKEDKQLVITILREYQETGTSKTLTDIWSEDYEEIPVPIDEFICNPYYLGKSTGNGDSIYPYWRKTYRKIFDPALAYEEIIFTGAIGVGKTKTADVCLAYKLYELMCLKNPQKYFKMIEGEEIAIFFLNINLDLAEGVGFNTLHKMVIASDWFKERGNITGRKKLRYNPPNNITIKFGSKSDHALGQQCYCALMDEADFTRGSIKGSSALDVKNEIMKTYNAIKERMNSRFIKNGKQYARLFLVSSKKSDQDFIEAYIKKLKTEGHDQHLLIIDEPQWVIKPEGTFSKEKFPVAVGNKSLKSRILNDDITKDEEEALKKQGYRILWVPCDLKQSFILDVNTALMNLAGISVIGATTFFNYDMFSKCYVQNYKNPFVDEILTIGMKDDLQIQDFFEIDKVPMAVRMMPQFIHIDASLTGDKTGISDVGASGVKELQTYDGADESIITEMTYKHIFSVDILAPQGTEISFEKTRKFIYYLKANGFNIVGVSLDGFQSADMRQMLETQGYDASIISMDKSPEGYLTLRSAMNDQRIGLLQIDLLEKELIELQRDVQTGKLDHPSDGCFTDDTKIRLVDGRTLTIKELMYEQEYKTNYVYTINLEKGCIEPKPIKKVFQTKLVTDLICVELDNGETVYCTPEHRFMLRDGTYIEARNLKEMDSLMPLYTKISEKGTVGYRLFYDPFNEVWHYEHRSFCTNIEKDGTVVHHKNYNKLDNCPTNLIKISNKKHTYIHNNNTLDYKKISASVKEWHRKNKYTEAYAKRSQKCREGVINYLIKTRNNYVEVKKIEQDRIRNIERLFNVSWDSLTESERISYGVKYSRIEDATITNRISETLSIRHKEGKFKNAYKAMSDRVWYTNGTENLYLKKYETPPDGYIRGRCVKTFNYKRKKFSELPPEEALERRRKCSASAKDKCWITNGTIEKYIDKNAELPEGFRFGRKPRKNHKVKNVYFIHKPCRVYDIEVDDNHNFALDAGIFVHNSKDMSDSLAGALLNATKHKQSLLDSMQLLSTFADVNTEIDARADFISDLEQSISHKRSQEASNVLDNLMNNYGDSNMLIW